MLPLFHQDLVVAPLSSGSRGNCTYIGTARSGVLVDIGLSPRRALERLAAIGLGDARIEAILVTHEHSDHVGGAAVLDRELERRTGERVPFHFTPGTFLGTKEICRPRNVVTVTPGQAFRVGALTIEPLSVPHDTADPVCYTVEHAGARAGVITDLGRSTKLVERQLSTLDVAVLEFNHDPELLLIGDYPWHLKQRIRGNHGHLSNEQSCALVGAGASARLKHLVLAHLSEENNRPELALDAAERGLSIAGSKAAIQIAKQAEALPFLSVPPEAPQPVTRPTRTTRRPEREPAPQASLFPALFR